MSDRPTYVIRDWDRHFECAQTRKLKGKNGELLPLNWLKTPTKHDGKSFSRIMQHPSGLTIFAVWMLMLQVAAKCIPRGHLVDEDGPLTPEDLALKTRAPVSGFELAIPVLSDPKIGWLEVWGGSQTGNESHTSGREVVEQSHSDPSAIPTHRTVPDRTGPDRNVNTEAIPGSENVNGTKTGAKPGPWSGLTDDMIRDAAGGKPDALLRHRQYMINCKAIPDVESSRLEFVAHAISVVAQKPDNLAAMFVSRFKKNRTGYAVLEDEDAAKQILRQHDHRQRPPRQSGVVQDAIAGAVRGAERPRQFDDGGEDE